MRDAMKSKLFATGDSQYRKLAIALSRIEEGETIAVDEYADAFQDPYGPLSINRLGSFEILYLRQYFQILVPRITRQGSVSDLLGHLNKLREDDQFIRTEGGVANLSREQVIEACEERGFSSSDEQRGRAWLRYRLELSLASPALPPSLLLFGPCMQTIREHTTRDNISPDCNNSTVQQSSASL